MTRESLGVMLEFYISNVGYCFVRDELQFIIFLAFLDLTDMVDKNKMCECARAVSWDTALKFSPQPSAMTSPDRPVLVDSKSRF